MNRNIISPDKLVVLILSVTFGLTVNIYGNTTEAMVDVVAPVVLFGDGWQNHPLKTALL